MPRGGGGGGAGGSSSGEGMSWEDCQRRKGPPGFGSVGMKGPRGTDRWRDRVRAFGMLRRLGPGRKAPQRVGLQQSVSRPRFPSCRCCSVLLSPQLYRDVPILRVHSFLLGGADGPGCGTVAYPGPCRLRPRLVSGPSHLPGILATPGDALGGI